MSFSSDIKQDLGIQPIEDDRNLERMYVRDSFISWGTCSDPKKAYHLEFNLPPPHNGDKLCRILKGFGLNPKKSKRRGHILVYLKEAENIVDALNIIGAHKALMAFENVRIVKELNNQVNRWVNCETANLEKTVSASVQQIEDIQLITKFGGLGIMPEQLQIVARLRLDNPDATLKEIGQMLSPPLGKSGVNHRIRKINAIAASLRE